MQTIHQERVDLRTWVGVLGTMLGASWPPSVLSYERFTPGYDGRNCGYSG